MKLILSALIILTGLLQYELWFSTGGVKTVWQLKKDIEKQQALNDSLAKKNDDLAKSIKALKHSKVAIETRARHELGMIKKNEVFYQVVK